MIAARISYMFRPVWVQFSKNNVRVPLLNYCEHDEIRRGKSAL